MLFVIIFFLVEILLRLLGYQPGFFAKDNNFKKVETLQLYKDFETDEAGIYKFSSWVYDSIPRYLNLENGTLEKPSIKNSIADIDQIDYVYFSFNRLTNPNSYNSLIWKMAETFKRDDGESKFKGFYNDLKDKEEMDAFDSLVLKYAHQPFNSEGFRSISFETVLSDKPKILLIGDSFVYGLSAYPFHASFYDFLLATNQYVLAAGVPGTDPAQYAAIAQKYIPIIKPDLVILCFFEGNDIMQYYREPNIARPHEHLTNAGFFQSEPCGAYLNPQESYEFYKDLISVPMDGSFFTKLSSKSTFFSMLWGILNKDKLPAYCLEETQNSEESNLITSYYINRFDSICTFNCTDVLYTIIPNKMNLNNSKSDNIRIEEDLILELFGDKKVYYPLNLVKEEDFPRNDNHFNNQGAEKFGIFIDSLISIKQSKND